MRPDIMTASGRYFNFLHPEVCTLSVEDIAHALSHLCRFTGHCREFYSVAQHAVLCSYIVPDRHAYEALHHDDAEAVLGDVASPLKRLLPDYKAIEKRVEAALRFEHGLSADESPEVKRADLVMLATEKRDLMPLLQALGAAIVVDGQIVQAPFDDPWACLNGIQPLPFRIYTWSPAEARERYLSRHRELAAGRIGLA